MTFSINTTAYRSPNHSSRKNPLPNSIVLHTGEGTRQSDLAWLCKPQGEKSVSSHYYVCRDGTIYQLVDDSREAWHAGSSEYLGFTGWGDFSLGIETEHKQGQDWPQVQRDALAWLCKQLIAKYNIRRSMVVAHRWIAPGRKHDPSDWPDAELSAWIEALYETDWAAAWGRADYDVVKGWGIPTRWRQEHLAGHSLGHALTGEQLLIDGWVYQIFEYGVVRWKKPDVTEVWR